jgi:hypothetical protein
MKALYRWIARPYRAVVIDGDGDRYEHAASSPRDALAWLSCYGCGVGVVYTRRGRIVAVRVC